MFKKNIIFLVISSLFLVLVSCSSDNKISKDNRTISYIMTSFYPLTYITTRLVGDTIIVKNLLPPDEDYASYVPERNNIVNCLDAKLFIINGGGADIWVDKLSISFTNLVKATSLFSNNLITTKMSHSHGAQGKHSHIVKNGYTWLSPMLLKKEVTTIYDALIKKFPNNKDIFIKNKLSLDNELDEILILYKKSLPLLGKKNIYGSRFVFSYLARDFGLTYKVYNLFPEIDYTNPENSEAINIFFKNVKNGIYIWQRPPLSKNIKLLQKHGVKSLVIDSCEATPLNGETFFSIMKKNIENINALIN